VLLLSEHPDQRAGDVGPLFPSSLLPVFFDEPCQMSFHLFLVVGEASWLSFISEDTLIPTLLAMCSNLALAGEGLFVGEYFLPGLSASFLLRVGSNLGEVVGDRFGDVVPRAGRSGHAIKRCVTMLTLPATGRSIV